MKSKSKFLARSKLRYERGKNMFATMLHPIQYISNLAMLSLWLGTSGINLPVWFPFVMLPIFIISFYFVGRFDEHKGLWKHELQYGTEKLNPTFKMLLRNQERLLELAEREGGKKND